MTHPPRPRPGAALVAVRMLLVVLAASAVVAAVALGRRSEPRAVAHYVCPMHAEVTAAAPGDCPICGMALEEVGARTGVAMPDAAIGSAGPGIAFAALRTSEEAASMLRFSVAPVRRNALPGEIFAPAIVEADGRIVAQLYRDEVAELTPDERAELIPNPAPGAAIPPIRVQRELPDAGPPGANDAIARVAFRTEPGTPAPPPGQIGWIKLAHKVRAMLVVRSAAITFGPDGAHVLVFSSQRGGLSRRPIEIGKDYAGMTAVVSGLADKELVVMANTFAFDAERRLRGAP
jgi:hypothetical protein